MAITKVTTAMKTAPTSAEVTAHVTAFDDVPVRRDIATLALHTAISDNKAAYNLSNAFIDQYEDSTGIDVLTGAVVSAENVSTISLVPNCTLTLTNGSGNAGRSSTQSKFGGYSARFDNDGADQDHLTSSELSGINRVITSGDWTVDFWARYDTDYDDSDRIWSFGDTGNGTQPIMSMGYNTTTQMNWFHSVGTNSNSTYPTLDQSWHHYAVQHDDSENNIYHYFDGVYKGNFGFTVDLIPSTTTLKFGRRHNHPNEHFDGYVDEWRLSNTKRYTNSVDFSVPTSAYSVDSNTTLLFHFDDANPTTEAGNGAGSTANATGNYTSATQTALASVSTMGIVVLYKNNAGTATLNTDLVAEVSANGGTNYASATLVAGGTFSTGINIAAVSGVSVTAGTTPKYKISFANQSSGSKETQIHGVALLY